MGHPKGEQVGRCRHEVKDCVLGLGGEFSAATRTLSWDIGELAPKGQPGSKGQVSFHVALKPGLANGTLIENQAVVYFSSVPEETPTNWVVNEVQSAVAYPQVVDTVSGASKPITLHGADVNGLPLTYQVTDAPLYGTLTGTPPNVVYTPLRHTRGRTASPSWWTMGPARAARRR